MHSASFVRFAVRVGVLGVVGAAAGAVATGPALAAGCGGSVRYAATSNTIYLTGGKIFTPTSIAAACAQAPLRLVDRTHRTWDLNADLVVQDGSTLVLKGGDVNVLRIRSMAGNRSTEVQQILSSYGTIDVDSVDVTSWDPVAGRPDTTVTLPATRLPTDRGRAFIRALSTIAPDGSVQQSKMVIRNSRFSYLGYDGPEAYGVTFKARGCDRSHLAACRKVTVTGSEVGSTFEHNYVGTYAWGATGIVFRGNTYRDNVTYGLDAHDGSSFLTIDRNRFTGNGNHGLICSQRCNRLSITDNVVTRNGARPSAVRKLHGGSHVDPVHGIMLHRGVTNAVVAGNIVTGQSTGAAIAVFDSSGNTISGNTVSNNLLGIRLTVGSSNNVVKNNVITGSSANAILVEPNTDIAVYSTRSGRPTNNLFQDNTISGTGGSAIRLIDADHTTIRGKSMTQLGGPLMFTRTADTILDSVNLPKQQPITVTGTAVQPSTVELGVARTAVVVNADHASTVTWK